MLTISASRLSVTLEEVSLFVLLHAAKPIALDTNIKHKTNIVTSFFISFSFFCHSEPCSLNGLSKNLKKRFLDCARNDKLFLK